MTNDSNWSVIYNTPLKQLLFRCGLKLDGKLKGRNFWLLRDGAYLKEEH